MSNYLIIELSNCELMRKIENYKVSLLERTKRFGIAVIKISSQLPKNPAGFTVADQVVRSSTSIGANLIEAQENITPLLQENNEIVKILIATLKKLKSNLQFDN